MRRLPVLRALPMDLRQGPSAQRFRIMPTHATREGSAGRARRLDGRSDGETAPVSVIRGLSRDGDGAPAAPPHLDGDGEEREPVSESRPSARGEKRFAPYIVVVAMDLSEPGGRAWRFAFDLAELRGEAEIHAVVIGPREMAPAVRDVATPSVSTTTSGPSSSGPRSLRVLQHRSATGQARLMAMHFRTGRPDRAIVDLARELSADLIVVATHPTTPLQRLFGGSTADRIARNATCPVVVVRPKNDDDDPGMTEYDPRAR